eukprot:364208-Chlamydomonas_euryale.AAC.17
MPSPAVMAAICSTAGRVHTGACVAEGPQAGQAHAAPSLVTSCVDFKKQTSVDSITRALERGFFVLVTVRPRLQSIQAPQDVHVSLVLSCIRSTTLRKTSKSGSKHQRLHFREVMAADKKNDDVTADMEAFLRAAKYTLVKFTDMNSEMKEESMDICITAVEKFPTEMEKCTQVRACRDEGVGEGMLQRLRDLLNSHLT